MPEDARQHVIAGFKAMLDSINQTIVTKKFMREYVSGLPIPEDQKQMSLYYMELAGRTS